MSRMENEASKRELEAALKELAELRGGPEAVDDFNFVARCLKAAKAVGKDVFGPSGTQPQTALAIMDCVIRMNRGNQKETQAKRDSALDAGEASFEP
jgi:hypothetical protein